VSGDGTSTMGPDDTARAFVDAVIWGDHKMVWDLLGIEGRTTVLRIAGDRGMDEALVARLRDGTAAPAERDEFLADLVNGLRADLAGNDLDALQYELDTAAHEPGRARVVVHAPLPPALGGTLPAASVELSSEAGEWRVERLVPLTSQP
jgi:hypothetical protein